MHCDTNYQYDNANKKCSIKCNVLLDNIQINYLELVKSVFQIVLLVQMVLLAKHVQLVLHVHQIIQNANTILVLFQNLAYTFF